MKRFLIFGLFLLVSFTLVACQETTTTTTAAPTTTTTTAAPTTTTTTTTTAIPTTTTTTQEITTTTATTPLPGVLPPLAPFVIRESSPDQIAILPPGGVVKEIDFTSATPITEFEFVETGTNLITYTIPGIGTIESRGFNTIAQLGKVIRQDDQGLHFQVNRIGEWSNNGEFRLINLVPGHIQVTAGAAYTVYVEVKWESGARPLRMVYAGKDNNATWMGGAANDPVGADFQMLKHHEVSLPGVVGAPATLANTERLDLRVGWMGNLNKNEDVSQVLIVKRVVVMRGEASSLHTTTSTNMPRVITIGGDNPLYDGSMVTMFLPEVGDGSQLPAVAFTGLQLLMNQQYELKFSHEALRKRSVEVFIGYWDEYGRLVPLLGSPDKLEIDSYSSRVTYTWNFVWRGGAIHDALLVFSYGDVGSTQASTTIKVGNITLYPKG